MREIYGYAGIYFFDDNLNIINSKTLLRKKTQISSCKYYVIDLYKNGVRKTELLHRLIALTFIENPNGYTDVNHKDGNRLNNNIENLEWCSRSYNILHSYKELGRISGLKGRTGINNHNSKAVLMYKNGEFVKRYESIMDVERETGILNNSVCANLKGKSKIAGGFTFKYAL